jgi:phosphohistidine phosphatase
MRLYVLRHAKAEKGEPDALRRLSDKGREQSRRLQEELADVSFDAVISSPLLRARETAALVVGREPEIDDRLSPGATAADVRAVVAGRGETVLIVGHNPDCPLIVAELTGGPEPDFPTAGLVVIEI